MPQDKDQFDLQRFVSAQGPVFDRALAELRAGHKQSHWMWFIFPQLRGLGFSPMAQHYGIESLDEARAYLSHAELGKRLDQCTRAVLVTEGRSLHQIFGSPDDFKFRSCMTLFSLAAPDESGAIFRLALDRYCDGQMDPRTLDILGLN